MRTTTLKQAKALAKSMNVGFTQKFVNNKWGGHGSNGAVTVCFDHEDKKATLVTTCWNCGDGRHLNVTKLANKFKK